MKFELHADAFANGKPMPLAMTMTGFNPASKNQSPFLFWSGAPEDTVSFALICQDPDAVGGTFTHWIVYNVLATMRSLPAGLPQTTTVELQDVPLQQGPEGVPTYLLQTAVTMDNVEIMQGQNDYGTYGYGGPKPPTGTGTHHYTFTLYALSDNLNIDPGATLHDLNQEMKPLIITQTQLIGTVTAPAT